VEVGRHVLISHADSASPFDSLLGAFALVEVIAAKVVAELGDAGRRRVGELETAHDVMRGNVSEEVAGGDWTGGAARARRATRTARRRRPTSRGGSRTAAWPPSPSGSSTRR
jgi:hypothetical protein